ncbi:MAG TPA: choice-of-anchor D domain-containing protein [Candidatus Limnocylindrales bacterium]|nr:choice-of-anchor D domain-containing protein [Candidatus Limnocylindrales bacterium]
MPAQYRYPVVPLILSILFFSLLITSGCGGAAKASSSPKPASAASAHVALSPTALDFGSVPLGVQKTSGVTLTNSHGSKATISSLTATGAGFSVVSAPPLPLVLGSGQSITVTLAFDPATAGPATGSFSVLISGSTSPITEALSGTGIAGNQLGVSPTAMDFGNVTLGTIQSQTGLLTAGSSSVTVSSASWTGAGYSLSGIAFPVIVPAGQSVPFTVSFEPTTAGASSGSISFLSDASNSPATETLSGSGLQPAHNVTLSWNPSTSTVAGYNVYRGSQSGGPYTLINPSLDASTSYSDTNVQSGLTYFYVVTAVDASSQESAYSNESMAVIPTP